MKVAGSIVTFFADEQNRKEVEHLREAGLDLPNPDYRAHEAGLEVVLR